MRHVTITLLMAILAIITLTACSAKEEPKNLFEGQKQAMDKAKAVEDQLQQAVEQRDEQIDEQTR